MQLSTLPDNDGGERQRYSTILWTTTEDGVLYVQHVYTTTMPDQTDTTMHNYTLVDTATTGIEQLLINKADDPVAEDGEIQRYSYCNMIYDYQNIIYTILALWICCSLRQSDEGTGGRTRVPVWRPDGSKLFRTWLEEEHVWITANPTMTTRFTEDALRRST